MRRTCPGMLAVTARTLGVLLLAGLAGCSEDSPTAPGRDDPRFTDSQTPVALTAMDTVTYLGFEGGLYPGGNELPPAHRLAGLTASAGIEPLDPSGQPDPAGSYVLLSIGMSNASQEFCSGSSATSCTSWSFVGQALADLDVAVTGLQIVNGASGGQVAERWDSPSDANYDRVLTERLQPRGLSELQVQAVWLKNGNPGPSVSLPSADADAFALERSLGDIVRSIRVRYPNTRLVFLSSRIYGGYATTSLNPEPYAYESSYSVKWLIQGQIDQEATGSVVDTIAGDLSIGGAAPWIGWGPYIWADGTSPNPDGLTWLPEDFATDGTHPSRSGQEKVGAALLDFFKSSPLTRTWFLR